MVWFGMRGGLSTGILLYWPFIVEVDLCLQGAESCAHLSLELGELGVVTQQAQPAPSKEMQNPLYADQYGATDLLRAIHDQNQGSGKEEINSKHSTDGNEYMQPPRRERVTLDMALSTCSHLGEKRGIKIYSWTLYGEAVWQIYCLQDAYQCSPRNEHLRGRNVIKWGTFSKVTSRPSQQCKWYSQSFKYLNELFLSNQNELWTEVVT